jgi:phosphate transport system substrate-binding protein
MVLFSAIASGADTIVIMGSDTIGSKLAVQLAEAYRTKMEARDAEVAFEISSEGTLTALASLIEGKTDIGMASRAPSTKERAKAEAHGVDLRAITVAHDAIAIIVHASNPIESIRLQDLEMIYSGEVQDWSGITPLHVGPISAYTRNTASGTYSILQQVAMASRDYGENTQKMAGNELIATEVAKNPHGIGYVGLAYSQTPGVKAIPIEGRSVTNVDYPLRRDLKFLINGNVPLNAMSNDFIGFTLSPEGQQIVRQVNFMSVY